MFLLFVFDESQQNSSLLTFGNGVSIITVLCVVVVTISLVLTTLLCICLKRTSATYEYVFNIVWICIQYCMNMHSALFNRRCSIVHLSFILCAIEYAFHFIEVTFPKWLLPGKTWQTIFLSLLPVKPLYWYLYFIL